MAKLTTLPSGDVSQKGENSILNFVASMYPYIILLGIKILFPGLNLKQRKIPSCFLACS